MGIPVEALHRSIDSLAEIEPAFGAALAHAGYPEPRISEPGYITLLRTIVGQQVSIHAARAIWNKLDAIVGGAGDPANLLAKDEATLRLAGLSRQKIAYARSLAELVALGELDLFSLPQDDEEAIAKLVQASIGRILGLDVRPKEKRVRELAEPWRPHRGAAAIFAWHHYKVDAAPIG